LADSDPPDDHGHSPGGEEGKAADSGLAPAPAPAAAEAAANPFEQRARLAEDRLAEVLAAYRTLKNENEEFRDRQSRNLERRYEQRRERLLLKFIDVLDNLDRALEAAQTSYAGQPLLEGMILVRTQLLQTLQDEGLERIPVLGLAFDPAVSESVGSEPVNDAEQHQIVVKELLRGYRLNGRVARPSRVVIGAFAGAEADVGTAATTPLPIAPPAIVPAGAPAGGPAAPSTAPPAGADDGSTEATTRMPAPKLVPPPSTAKPPPLPPRRKNRG
jgi:molecular chaperone GrpE